MMRDRVAKPPIDFRFDGGGNAVMLVVREDLGGEEIAALDGRELSRRAREAGVRIDEAVVERLEEVARSLQDRSGELEYLIAETIPAIDGVDGWLEWAEGFVPTAGQSCDADDDPSKRIDYYNCISYRCVLKGAVVARLHPPTKGRAGIDVTGRVLEPRPGRPFDIRLDDQLVLNEDGSIVTQCQGLLEGDGAEIKVSAVFLVDGSIDFSTGNVRFDGSTVVNENVGDRFAIRSSGNVLVRGLVQAATIECGGDFVCGQGMAGRDRGRLQVGGSVDAGYLNAVRGVVNGNLIVRRELINCRLQIGGDLIANQAAVIGGEICVGGTAQVGCLGCDRGRPTRVILETGGRLKAELQQGERARLAIEARIRERDLRGGNTGAAAAELRHELQEVEGRVLELRGRVARESVAQPRRIEVKRAICTGVHLCCGCFDVAFDERLEGPVVLEADGQSEPHFRYADGPLRSLAEVARIARRAA